MSTDHATYTIKLVAERTGVPLHTLRAWERRYGVPKPLRGADNRYRLYDDGDIADVLWLKRQVDAGVAPSQAGALLCRQKRGRESAPTGASAPRALAERQGELLAALLAFDEQQANRTLDEALGIFSLEQVAMQMVAPTMRAIGAKWSCGEAGVCQEHFASHVVRQRLLTALQVQPPQASSAPLLLAACAPEEQHELGLLMFALVARRHGWRVTYLGQRMPLADLLNVSRRAAPRAVIISATTVLGLANLMPLLEARNRPAAPLYFAGSMFELAPGLCPHMPGQCLGADFGEALRLLALPQRRTAFAGSGRALATAQAVRAHSMELAARTSEIFFVQHPKLAGRLASPISAATTHIAEALAAALAFETPELMDIESRWLRQSALKPAAGESTVREYLSAVEAAAAEVMGKAPFAALRPLMARMKKDLPADVSVARASTLNFARRPAEHEL